jgi:hypothetical protein
MVIIKSNHLSCDEYSIVKKFCKFALRTLVIPSVSSKSKITVKVLASEELRDAADALDLKVYKAWCTYDGIDNNGNKKFTIVVNYKRANKRAKSTITKLKNLLIDLGHELVHVKQYLNNEIFDYSNGNVRFKGTIYDRSHYTDEEKYFQSPWEIDAYGREWGLYVMFKNKLKRESINVGKRKKASSKKRNKSRLV